MLLLLLHIALLTNPFTLPASIRFYNRGPQWCTTVQVTASSLLGRVSPPTALGMAWRWRTPPAAQEGSVRAPLSAALH